MAAYDSCFKVAGVKVYHRQTWNFRSHAVSACIGLWCHRLMHAPHRFMHACTACIATWHHRLMHAVTAWALLFWFCLRCTFTSSYFVKKWPTTDLYGSNKQSYSCLYTYLHIRRLLLLDSPPLWQAVGPKTIIHIPPWQWPVRKGLQCSSARHL